MPTLQIYDKLLQFPLFQGMSHDDLEIIAGHTRFGFQKVQAGKMIAKAGDTCNQLLFLINGSVRVVTHADDYGYAVEEQLSSPYIFQLESIFGYHQRYTHDYTALMDVNFLMIDKEEVIRLSEDFLVFRLNLLNNFATQTQKQVRQVWARLPQTLSERILRFFVSHCVYPAGRKEFRILMVRLADELNESRLNVSRALNDMQHSGLIVLGRGKIEIPQLERLLTISV